MNEPLNPKGEYVHILFDVTYNIMLFFLKKKKKKKKRGNETVYRK